MAAPQASSRLEMLQARFQQKQLQEKEQKLLQLYDQQQQRAYQVAQRGSSGSNSSGQGTSTVNHHHQIVTKTSSSGHSTSTSQATKVKQQVFNDRRQTTSVKGIDRSYPLEPLDNKTRKQPISNGIGNSRNNGLTVNRQSITVKRVTRSDLNSNVNDAKPIVSYHEEITRESSSSRDVPHIIESTKEDDVEVFDNENHTTHYVNGNYPDKVQMENIMDEDTIQRNRMMAKLHLMQYDETLKYRVKNDLESEEFPEDLLVEVTDKIPKRTISKKLSQAEARLERFKNMNAKRNNAIKLLNSTTTGGKKRSEPLPPSSRTNSRVGINGVATTTSTTTTKKNKKKIENIREKRSNKLKVEKGSVKYGQVAFEKSKTEEGKSKKIRYDRKTGTSNESSIFQKRKADVPGQDETIDPTDSRTFFSNESKKSATKISIDILDNSKRSPKPFSNTKRHIQNREISFTKVNNFPITTASNNDKHSNKIHGKRDSSSFSSYRRPSVSSTTTSVESKRTPSPELIRTLKKRDTSPEFVCVETKKSATTMSLKPRPKNLNEDKRLGINSNRDFQSKIFEKMIAKQSPSYLKLERNIRKSSDSSETSNKSFNLELKSQRNSINALRSIQLIRNVLKTQNAQKTENTKDEEDRLKIHSLKYSNIKSKENERKDRTSSVINPVRKNSLKIDIKDTIDLKNVTNRERKNSLKNIDTILQLSPKSPKSTKSFTSTEVDTEIQEITMTDQHVNRNDTISKNKEERNKKKKSISDVTYSKSSATNLRKDDKKKIGTTNLLTYPIRKEKKKKRSSVLDSNIFHPKDEIDKVRKFEESNRSLNEKSWKKEENGVSVDVKGLTSSKPSKKNLSKNKIEKIIVSSLGERRNSVDLKNIKNESSRSKSSTSICTNEDVEAGYTKNLTTNVSLKDITFDESRKEIKERKDSPLLYKRIIRTSTEEMKGENPNKELLRSTELIKRVIRAQSFDKQNDPKTELMESIKHNKSFDRFSKKISMISLSSNNNYYGRTDSVESALRRFDSIGAESEYQDTIGRDCVDGIKRGGLSSSKISIDKIPMKFTNEAKESIKTKTNILESSEIKKNQSKFDSKKNIKNTNVGVIKKNPSISKKIFPTKVDTLRASSKGKKIEKARDSMEISQKSKSRSLATCKRKLFQDLKSEETKIKRLGCTLKNQFRTGEKVNVNSRKSMKISTIGFNEKNKRKEEEKKKEQKDEEGMEKKEEEEEEDDRTVVVKPLRSIEDIRKSIVCDSSSGRTVVALTQITDIDLARQAETGSAIANEILKASTKSESQSRIVVDSDPLNRKNILSKNRSKNNSHLRNNGTILSTNYLRLDRINKSPSPESSNSKKSSEIDCRTILNRRSVPSSPSKSPDILPRRVSTLESKSQETKPSIKSSFVKASDTITSKRSATRTDVPNALQNGLHLQEQIVERKEQNELPKKCQAFTIDFEERPSSKTNDSTDSKRPLAKKQSVEKQQQQQQTPSSAISGRPTSSTSSASSGNQTQTQVSSSKGRMATRARTPISNTLTSKGSSSIKTGAGQNVTDNLTPCKICGRRFAQDRVTLHEQICAKTVQKKRKQFDTTMYRVKGTELESFVKKGSKKSELKSKKPEVKSNWRRKHEEFINAIRSAKQVQAHLAAGGRLSDLPPPPVSDTSDYIQCPHCGRKFNQMAAERHIPKCEHMLHNKPSSRAAPPRPRR